MVLESMTDSPRLRRLWLKKADRCSCPGSFARYSIPATRSQLASPIRVQGRALKSCLVLCLAIFGAELCLFRRVLFLVVDELSTLGRRPDNCTGPSFQLGAQLPLKSFYLLGPLTKDSDFLVREHIHFEITLGSPEPVTRIHELFRYPRVKRRLVEPFIRDYVA